MDFVITKEKKIKFQKYKTNYILLSTHYKFELTQITFHKDDSHRRVFQYKS